MSYTSTTWSSPQRHSGILLCLCPSISLPYRYVPYIDHRVCYDINSVQYLPHSDPPPRSGTVLVDDERWPAEDASQPSPPPDARQRQHDDDHHRPPVTIHSASVPLEYLSRGVDRSFVGAPPLRLAAFRRLLDHHRHSSRTTITTGATAPATAVTASRNNSELQGTRGGSNQDTGNERSNHRYDGDSGGGGGSVSGGGGGGAVRIGGGAGGSDGAGDELDDDSGGLLEGRREADAGGGRKTGQREVEIAGVGGGTGSIRIAGDGDLERAGCLIEVRGTNIL